MRFTFRINPAGPSEGLVNPQSAPVLKEGDSGLLVAATWGNLGHRQLPSLPGFIAELTLEFTGKYGAE